MALGRRGVVSLEWYSGVEEWRVLGGGSRMLVWRMRKSLERVGGREGGRKREKGDREREVG